ncbi:response regulator transcription factor [Streptomyces tubercidicus]
MTLPTLPLAPRILTRRQEEVLRHMLRGATANEIAKELRIGRATVQTHLRAIYLAFGVKTRALAVIAAIERGYLPGEVDAVWMHDREKALRALRQAWRPCRAHPVHAPDCVTCVRAATLTQAMILVRDPRAVPSPPPTVTARRADGPRRPQPGAPVRRPALAPVC